MEQKQVKEESVIEIDLLRLFVALKKQILLILAVGLLFAGGGAAYTRFFVTPTYQSSSTMLVLTKKTTLSSLADLQLGRQLTTDYSLLVTSRPVLQQAIDNLGLEMNYKSLRGSIQVENPMDTSILYITVTQNDPILAKQLVDEVSKCASVTIGEMMEETPPKIIEEGEVPLYKSSPNTKKNILLAFLAGVVLVAGVVVVLEVINDTIKGEEDVLKYLDLPTLANIPDKKLEEKVVTRESKKKGK